MYRTTLATFLSPLIGGKLVDLMQEPGVIIDSIRGYGYGSTTHEDIIDENTSTYFEAYSGDIGDWLSVEFQEAKKINSIYLLPVYNN